ncbi:putative proline-rich protein PRCC [Lupinus albus]|uniref:Putative proline-rich protein PRCC n=1 Tax=Lupinus albus TaxID=3870 RepID=A0A6A4PLP5_LUPAL|nr:putative proline-rich protein PRCC [Lupinus albus]
MDSLLANYASSDEEEEEQQLNPISSQTTSSSSSKSTSSFFSSLPKPKSCPSSSFLSSLPQPKSSSSPSTLHSLSQPIQPSINPSSKSAKSSSLFSSLPNPNSQIQQQPKKVSGASDNAIMFPGKKRGRNEIPIEVIEVKQEELIKNRPREDQVKLTGVAFGPSYQPVSAKGKPTKLHKRKHQISSLYFDMKQNEMQLAERRAKGMLTKAETQAKYGW